jgi:exoribonuclease-2
VVRGKPENFNRPDYNFRLVPPRARSPGRRRAVEITVRRAARRWT